MMDERGRRSVYRAMAVMEAEAAMHVGTALGESYDRVILFALHDFGVAEWPKPKQGDVVLGSEADQQSLARVWSFLVDEVERCENEGAGLFGMWSRLAVSLVERFEFPLPIEAVRHLLEENDDARD